MKRNIKNILQYLFHPLAKKIGYSKTTYKRSATNKNTLISNCCNTLKQTGFNPKHIVDVGANRGTWTRELLIYFPDAYYSLFEPQLSLKESMSDILNQNSKVTFNHLGVGNKKGVLKFTIVDREDSCTFKYTAEEADALGYQQMDIPVISLNEHFKDSKLPLPDIIKIDAEGFDLKVLEGASDFFGKTEVFLVEVGVMNRQFENSCLEVMKFMDTNGYTLFDVTDLNRPFGNCLWLMELVFVNKTGNINAYNFTTEQ